MLEIKNLCFSAESETGKTEILKNLSLTVPDGKFIVITGPNGGGKSTLAKLIMGIEKPVSGQIFWNGQDITALDVPSGQSWESAMASSSLRDSRE